MKNLETRIIWGLLLIVAGAVFLLHSLGILPLDNVWPLVFGLPGLVFLLVFVLDRESWWAAIPGGTLLGIGSMMAYEQIARETPGDWEAVIVLAGIALGFVAIYLRTGLQQWWAIIPGGVLTTVALTVGLESYFDSGEAVGGVFMLGLGLTFALVYLVPTPSGRMTWALIPAGILAVIGTLGLLASTAFIQYVWPLALILVGGYIILRGMRRE